MFISLYEIHFIKIVCTKFFLHKLILVKQFISQLASGTMINLKVFHLPNIFQIKLTKCFKYNLKFLKKNQNLTFINSFSQLNMTCVNECLDK